MSTDGAAENVANLKHQGGILQWVSVHMFVCAHMCRGLLGLCPFFIFKQGLILNLHFAYLARLAAQ